MRESADGDRGGLIESETIGICTHGHAESGAFETFVEKRHQWQRTQKASRETTDAAVVGCDPGGDPVEYTGSATTVGAAARASTRDAVLASVTVPRQRVSEDGRGR